MSCRLFRDCCAFACFLLLALGCGYGTSPQQATQVPDASQLTSKIAASPTSTPPYGLMGTDELKQVKADLDNDGAYEEVSLRRSGETIELAIQSGVGSGGYWHMSLPTGVDIVDLRTQDVNGDGVLELLVETRGPEAHLFSLGVLVWDTDRGRFLTPRGAPSSNDRFFLSEYYPAVIRDLVSDTTFEIITAVHGADPRFLDSIVYEWNGQDYRKTELYLVYPRPVPTTSSP